MNANVVDYFTSANRSIVRATVGSSESDLTTDVRRAWALVLDDGSEVPFTEHGVVVGREPVAEEPDDVVIHVNDEHGLVSGNHLRVWTKDGSAWARDLGSRNGSFILENGEHTQLSAVGSTALDEGDTLFVGTRWMRIQAT